ncbi:MAG: hypothetical protein Q4F56_00210 [Candidatus Saccharibacteria bacterium]|nr:hypothetical protein [Candidatus Saccharibacteria bacterium]
MIRPNDEKYKKLLSLLGLFSLTFFSASILASTTVSADDSVIDDVAITVPSSCTIAGTGMSSHTAEIVDGIYTPDIGATTLKVFCNDAEGFAIYATGYTGNEIGGTNSNKLVGSPSEIGNIVTGTATSGTTSNWAMKLATNANATNAVELDNGFGSYSSVPNAYMKVAHRNSSTDTGDLATGAELTTTYAAYISNDQPAGNYSGQVIYTLVHPASETPLQPQITASGKICYYANASNAVGTMGCQIIPEAVSNDISPTAAILLPSNFSRDGYGFAGWSDAHDYATNANAHFYGPQEEIAFTEGQYTSPNNGLSLYAVWIKSQGSLQDTSKVATLCGTGAGSLTTAPTDGTANLSSVSALTDQRDNNTYAIAKLADGKCWMIENLRLESTAAHNSDGTLAQGYGTSANYGNFSGLADAESTNFSYSNPAVANSLYYSGTQSGTASIDIGTTDSYPSYRMPRYNNWNHQASSADRPQAPTSRGSVNSITNASLYSYGNYYTWPAVVADLSYYSTNNRSATSTSLCPVGWHLPQGGNKDRIESNDDNDFWNLIVDSLNGGISPANYDNQREPYYENDDAGAINRGLRAFPNNFLYSGKFYGSSTVDLGSVGGYWSSTVFGAYNAFEMSLSHVNVTGNVANGSRVHPGTNFIQRHYGLTVRCMSGG